MKKTLAVIMVIVMLICAVPLSVNAATNAVTYTWQGTHAYDAGFAQGTITVSVDGSSGGTYFLYWADDSAALSGFSPICKLNVSNNGSASYTMPKNTAIPAKATRVVAFKTSSEPSNPASLSPNMVYKLPIDKAPYKTDGDLLYKFASYSDIHITSGQKGAQGSKYPYDEEHLADAFRTAAARDVDFIVTTGDHVTNHRNDETGKANPHYPEEWNTYLQILAQSDYDNPIYEAIGNHELWNYEDDNVSKTAIDWKTGSNYFCNMTGLDSTDTAVNAEDKKAYYEITEPNTGDHFLFMAQEGGFYTDANDQFSPEQLAWLRSKLNEYENDGKNTFIMEHANFNKWGAGDQIDNPIYDIPLKESSATPSTAALKGILQEHKDVVLLCGHTHFQFDLNLNYSNNNKTSATIIHNSSVGAIRNIVGGTTRVNDTSREGTEGYIVEVYDNATIFYGTNLYYNKINPSATYIVPQRTSRIEEPTQAPEPTDPPTEAPTQPPTAAPTEAPTQPPTEPPVTILYGDADDDSEVSIMDATYIQRYEVDIPLPNPINLVNADVDGDGYVNVMDATYIQRWMVGIYTSFPAEEAANGKGNSDLAAEAADIEIEQVAADVELEPAAADLNTLRSQAKTALDKYWLLASYDQYQALKKAYRRNADYDTLNAAYAAFNTAVGQFYPGDSINIYFTKKVNWDNVYIYCTAGSGKAKNAIWPGEKLTQTRTNGYGELQYVYNVPTSKYVMVIFNNGTDTTKTVDMPLGAVKNQGFYYNSSLGKTGNLYRCSYFIEPIN